MEVEIKYNSPIIIFYHNDLDGILSAMSIKMKYDNNLVDDDYVHNVFCVPCDYNQKFNLQFFKDTTRSIYDQCKKDQILNKPIVYMVDYGINPNEDIIKFNNWLINSKVEFNWIDHHSKTIENVMHFNIPGLQRIGTSGCKLTWEFLNPGKEVPKIIDIISDFDVFNELSQYDKELVILPLVYYLDSFTYDMNDNTIEGVKLLKKCFFDNTLVDQCIERGKFISKYMDSISNKNNNLLYYIDFEGYKAVVYNTPLKGAWQFKYNKQDVDLQIIWYYNGNDYAYSFYQVKDNVDCGEIASKFGGGGSKTAAGTIRKVPLF